ncbi:hypothetical protein MASR2M17_17230 [Aminivibrio sp.]
MLEMMRTGGVHVTSSPPAAAAVAAMLLFRRARQTPVPSKRPFGPISPGDQG